MNANLKNSDFGKRLKTMLKVDARRMFTTPTVWIMLAISLALPILILVMTSFMGGADPETGEAIMGFTNVWQAIGSAGGNAMSMDLTSMCNINLLYFLVAIFVCVFVSEDFRSGYVKNLFTVRSKKLDYVLSKTIVLFVAAAGMFVLYFVGAMVGGGFAGLSFDVAAVGASAGGIIACMISKVFFALVFVSIALTLYRGKAKIVALDPRLLSCGNAPLYDDPHDDAAQFRRVQCCAVRPRRASVCRGTGRGQQCHSEQDEFGIKKAACPCPYPRSCGSELHTSLGRIEPRRVLSAAQKRRPQGI